MTNVRVIKTAPIYVACSLCGHPWSEGHKCHVVRINLYRGPYKQFRVKEAQVASNPEIDDNCIAWLVRPEP